MKPLLPAAFVLALLPSFLHSQVILNEIMYFPEPHEPEWVELYNAGTEPVTIQGWTIREDSNSSGSGTVPFSAVMPAGSYLVITGDLEKFTDRWGEIPAPVIEAGFSFLNNDKGDCVRLRNGSGGTVDEVCYGGDWEGRNGKSLERRSPEMPSVDSATWGGSVDPDKGTPGRANSIGTSAVPSAPAAGAMEIEAFPNPAAGYVRVRLNDPAATEPRELLILDMSGAVIRTVVRNAGTAAGSEEHIPLAGLPSGLYRICIRGNEEESAGVFITVLR